MLSGLNNLSTYTLLDEEYSPHFGFSETEVSSLLQKQQLAASIKEVKSWYNGYKVGNLESMYNPWSIIFCLSKSGGFDVYWVNTGNNDLIKELILSADTSIKESFEKLMQGNTLKVAIDKHLSFDLLGTSENALWSLLLFAGYLKVVDKPLLNTINGFYDCVLAIPNREVTILYNRFFEDWLVDKFPSRSKYDAFLKYLLSGKIEEFTHFLRTYLLESVSFFEVNSKQGESFYHGFVLALLASLRENYSIRSNRKSGSGRYDVLLIAKNPYKESNPKALLLEFKHTPKEEQLELTAMSALEQIQEKSYASELAHYPYLKEVLQIRIAFSKKSLLVAYTTYDLLNKKTSEIRIV